MRFPGWSSEKKRCVTCANVEQKQRVMQENPQKTEPVYKNGKRLIKFENISTIVGLYFSQNAGERKDYHRLVSEISHLQVKMI